MQPRPLPPAVQRPRCNEEEEHDAAKESWPRAPAGSNATLAGAAPLVASLGALRLLMSPSTARARLASAGDTRLPPAPPPAHGVADEEGCGRPASFCPTLRAGVAPGTAFSIDPIDEAPTNGEGVAEERSMAHTLLCKKGAEGKAACCLCDRSTLQGEKRN